MKKRVVLGLTCLISLLSCVHDLQDVDPFTRDFRLMAITEHAAQSRTVVESETQIFWEPGDSIKVFCNSQAACFVADLNEKAAQAEFVAAQDGFSQGNADNIWAIYPYSEASVFDGDAISAAFPSRQVARAESFGKNMNISVAHSATSTLHFCNVGGGVRFSVMEEGIREVVLEGMDGETLAGNVRIGFQEDIPVVLGVTEGKSSISLTPQDGETFQKGRWYFFVTIPGALEKGFKMYFHKVGELGSRTFDKSVTLKRSLFGTLTHADEGVIYTPIQEGSISFRDPLVKSIVVKHFDTDCDGELSFLEAAVVLSFLVDENRTRSGVGKSSIFAGTGISFFDEIIYFTSLTQIEDGAFAGCTQLSSVTLPENISSIGANAFNGCTGLQSITLTSSIPPVLGIDAFANSGHCPISVPTEAVAQYVSAWNEYADRIQATFVPTSPVPEAVDLGLSVKWASFNLGASKPEDYGDYYAWGETEPYYSSNNPWIWKEGLTDGYYWTSYRWGDGGKFSLTKYCPEQSSLSYGTIDDKTILDPEDDAAHAHLGGSWRMPTGWEIRELYDFCTAEWTTENGINGYRVTSTIEGYTDKSIFLPASGEFFKKTRPYLGSRGHYWSSSLASDLAPGFILYYIPINALCISLFSPANSVSRFSVSGYERYRGNVIRPVLGDDSDIPVETVSLDKNELVMSVGETQTLIAAVYPENATHSKVYWTSAGYYSDDIVSVSPTGVITALKVGSAIVTVTSYSSGKSATCKITVAPPPYVADSPEAVDLGLPSGLKWASFNLGASKPEDYGDYFAWGETRPYYFSQNPIVWNPGREPGYSIKSYSWCKDGQWAFTKYCCNPDVGYNGFTDYKTVLDPEDDAASVTLGSHWRMPTMDDLEELRKHCTWEQASRDGVEGRQVTGPNGNSIFLPLAGYISGNSLSKGGTDGFYLSSSLYTESSYNSSYVFYLGLDSTFVGVSFYNRYSGYTVRPVYSE